MGLNTGKGFGIEFRRPRRDFPCLYRVRIRFYGCIEPIFAS